jgi:hypothetical protein
MISEPIADASLRVSALGEMVQSEENIIEAGVIIGKEWSAIAIGEIPTQLADANACK